MNLYKKLIKIVAAQLVEAFQRTLFELNIRVLIGLDKYTRKLEGNKSQIQQ